MNQCRDASVCPANALPGSDYCAQHTGKPSRAEVAKGHREAAAVLDDELEEALSYTSPPGFVLPRQSLDRESLLTFRHGGEIGKAGGFGNDTLIGETQRPFIPKGLMLWNVGYLQVEAALIGTDLQLVCSFGKVPAAWFATQQSFEAVVLAQRAGDAAGWGHWRTVHPGVYVRLQFDGPAAHVRALMWGLST